MLVELVKPTSDGAYSELHVFLYLVDAQALGFDHLYDLQLEAGIKYSFRFRVAHGLSRFVLTTDRAVCFY